MNWGRKQNPKISFIGRANESFGGERGGGGGGG